MKTDLAHTTEDASDSSSEYSLISTESPDIENVEKLKEKISNQDAIIRDFETKLKDADNSNKLNQNEKIKLYEATIRDKNNLLELMKEIKELEIKQLKDQVADLQNVIDLSKNLTSNEDDANAAESAEFEKKLTENEDFQTLQKQFAESQSQIETLKDVISQLKSTNFELKSKMDEIIKGMAILEEKSDVEQDTLKAKIVELEKNAKILAAKSKKEEAKLAKSASNAKSCHSTDAPFVLLNHSKVPNIKFIKIGDQKKLAIVEDISYAGPDWIVILRRFDGSVSFKYLTNSIGELYGEFWFGLESIQKLTSSIRHELYIQLVDFDDVTAYARYDNFVVGNSREQYALKSLGAYSGNAGDALRSHVNSQLSHDFGNIWLSSSNGQCNLTGEYKKSKEQCSAYDMHWGNWYLGKRYPLKACKMLIRPYQP